MTGMSQANDRTDRSAGCLRCGFTNPAGFRFCGQCGAALTGKELMVTTPVRDATDRVSFEAERRHLTVLFCDLVDSVGWSRRLDPEDFRQVLSNYRAMCQRIIARYGGTHVRYVGDGVRVYFGYPEAHEDDAERAVLAGLDIVRRGPALSWRQTPADNAVQPDKLALRIGIATGLVVAGQVLDDNNDDGLEAVGETPNLAARLQTLAPPNTVIIAEATRLLLGQLFDLQDLGKHALKGFEQPVQVWQVRASRGNLSRYEATRNPATPLVNRTAELAHLTACWTRVRAPQGQVVLLRGEAGIGKSRLAKFMRDRIVEQSRITLLYYQCSPYHSNSALYPIATQLERSAKIHPDDSLTHKRLKLRRLLRMSQIEAEQDFPLIAGLLGLAAESGPDELEFTPARRRAQLLQALVKHLCGLASQQPVLLIFEDLHWIDPSSLELLQQGIAAIQDLPVFMLLTARTEFEPPWPQTSYCHCFDLEHLQLPQIEAIVRNLAVNKQVASELLGYVGSRAGGNPLYAEELTKTVLQDHNLVHQDGDTYRLVGVLPEYVVPASLQDLLIARLDKLSPMKFVAQTAAVIGREVDLQLLARVVQLPQEHLLPLLDQLVAAQILQQHRQNPQQVYVFRHALMQEAAYESLLKRRRRELHQRVAVIVEQEFPQLWSRQPEILAHHFSEAGLGEQAIKYWLQAGQLANERYANHEAVRHLLHGLALLSTLTNPERRKQQELALRIALGPALIATKGPGTEDVQRNYQQAIKLCEQLPESAEHFAAYWGWWRVAGNFQVMQKRAQQMLQLAERLNDPGLRLQAHHSMWASLFHLGQPTESLEHVQNGLALYEHGDFRAHAAVYGGHDAKVCALGEAAQTLWLLGYPEQSQVWLEKTLVWAESFQHTGSLLHALDMCLLVAYYLRAPDTVRDFAARLIAVARDGSVPDYEAKGQFFQGWAVAQAGETTSGLNAMEQALQTLHAVGTSEDVPVFCDMLAEIYGACGQFEQGLDQLDFAFRQADTDHTYTWLAELHRCQGELLCLQQPDDFSAAQGCFLHALTVARSQQAKSLELRAARSLARSLCAQGQQAQAAAILRPVYDWFSEGFDTLDLRQTAELLDVLD